MSAYITFYRYNFQLLFFVAKNTRTKIKITFLDASYKCRRNIYVTLEVTQTTKQT